MKFYLSQVNVAIAKFAYGDSEFSGFVDNLDRINSLAESSAGFVWRYVSDDDDAEAKRVFGDERALFNMSMWKSLDDLHEFVYKSDHLHILRQRADWFIPQDGPAMALWWQLAGDLPSPMVAKHRLQCLGTLGPTQDAFTFRSAFDPPA